MSLSKISRRCYLAGVAAMAIAAGGLFAASPVLAQAKLEPLADGFPNRPIVLLVVDEPGSTDSVFASQIAEAASKISPQPVTVEHRIDFTNFGTWEALAWVKDQGEIVKPGLHQLHLYAARCDDRSSRHRYRSAGRRRP